MQHNTTQYNTIYRWQITVLTTPHRATADSSIIPCSVAPQHTPTELRWYVLYMMLSSRWYPEHIYLLNLLLLNLLLHHYFFIFFDVPSIRYNAIPFHYSSCLALPCLALPCLALPCLASPRLCASQSLSFPVPSVFLPRPRHRLGVAYRNDLALLTDRPTDWQADRAWRVDLPYNIDLTCRDVTWPTLSYQRCILHNMTVRCLIGPDLTWREVNGTDLLE